MLSPGVETVKQAQAAATPEEWGKFAKKYRSEMNLPEARQCLALLAALSHQTDFSVGCYCDDESHCHRSVLREILMEHGAAIT